jgi:oligoendopeptidase F
MELLGAQFLGEFYNEAAAKRSYRDLLEEVILLFPWIALVDAFQHWLYTNEGHTTEERKQTWLNLQQRFGGGENWQGYEDGLSCLWQKQPHLFVSPFYYIEYGIAQLGALQMWQAARRDLDQTVQSYRSALALGGSKPLPDLFRACGLAFDFSRKKTEILMGEVMDELDSLAGV